MYLLDTAKDAFDIILQIGAGTGLLYLVRWFWWRVNAWCEVVAMVSSFARLAACCSCWPRTACTSARTSACSSTIAVTTVCWVATAYLGPETDRAVLVDFYQKVRARSARAGSRSARTPGVAKSTRAATARQHPARACSAGSPGCTAIWSALFTVGNFLYGRNGTAISLLCRCRRQHRRAAPDYPHIWADSPEETAPAS